jgi:hypothetical protein
MEAVNLRGRIAMLRGLGEKSQVVVVYLEEKIRI